MDQTDSNIKVIAGFLAGVLFAGGGVYMLTSKSAEPVKPALTMETPSSPVVSEPVAQSASHETHEPMAASMKSAEPVKMKSMPTGHQQHSPAIENRMISRMEDPKSRPDPVPAYDGASEPAAATGDDADLVL